MSGNNEAEGLTSEPAAVEGSNTAEELDTDEEDDAAEETDGDN